MMRVPVENISGSLILEGWFIEGVFGNVATGVRPEALQIRQIEDGVVLTWSNPAFSLEASGAIGGTYTRIYGATSPYTNAIGVGAKFFRLANP